MTLNIKDYMDVRERQPNGLNILDALFRENAALKEEVKVLREAVLAHEERLNNLSFNIPDATLNAIISQALNVHAQVLLAAIKPAPVAVQHVEDQPVEVSDEIEAEVQEPTE